MATSPDLQRCWIKDCAISTYFYPDMAQTTNEGNYRFFGVRCDTDVLMSHCKHRPIKMFFNPIFFSPSFRCCCFFCEELGPKNSYNKSLRPTRQGFCESLLKNSTALIAYFTHFQFDFAPPFCTIVEPSIGCELVCLFIGKYSNKHRYFATLD